MSNYFIHPSATVDEGSLIGANTKIWHYCHIYSTSKIGKNCIIGQNVMIGPNVEVGDGCKIQNNVSIYEGVTLKENVFVGPSVVFTNVMFPRAHIEQKNNFKETIVNEGCTIGANSTIVAGNDLGEYSMIGAGSVVTKKVNPFTLVFGNPAKFKYKIDSQGNRI